MRIKMCLIFECVYYQTIIQLFGLCHYWLSFSSLTKLPIYYPFFTSRFSLSLLLAHFIDVLSIPAFISESAVFHLSFFPAHFMLCGVCLYPSSLPFSLSLFLFCPRWPFRLLRAMLVIDTSEDGSGSHHLDGHVFPKYHLTPHACGFSSMNTHSFSFIFVFVCIGVYILGMPACQIWSYPL